MTFGYIGKMLRVDLTRGKISTENREEQFYRRYIGGEGFVAYFLLKESKPGADPLGPENKLIFAAGPLTGTSIAGSGRNSVGAKSPLTGGFGEAEVGGHWGAELKRAGFDAIIVEGRAEKPVYLWVNDGEAEIRDADHLWGNDTGDTQRILREELNDKRVQVAQIGPGGERLVRYACVMNGTHDAAGRTGMGAVMGSKKLKAVAIRGRKKIKVADAEKLKELRKWLLDNPKFWAWAHDFGTGGDTMEAFVSLGNLPVRNFRDGDFPNAVALDARTIRDTIRVGMESCYACPVRCKKVVKIEEPWRVDPVYGGPEYEALASLGSNCGVDDLKAVCKANEICNRYSLDVISTGVSIGFAMECYEDGILSDEDTGGLKLNFGNAQAMVKMVEMIGGRQGLGSVLAEGVKKAAEKIGRGAERFAVHVKGQEFPMHEPRLKKGLGLGYAVSPTGAEHMCNLGDMPLASERGVKHLAALGILEPVSIDDLGPKKVRALIYFVDWGVLNNSLLMCDFLPWSFIQTTEIVRAVTGWNATTWALMKTGEKITTMARAFNVREGLTKDDDWLPQRVFHPKTSGELSKTAVDPGRLEKSRDIYYEMMGWDGNGVPTRAKLEELDLGWIAQMLNF